MGNTNPQLPPFPLTSPYPYNTSLRVIYAPYEPLPRLDFYDQPSCLGSNIFNEALRKSDQVYQNLMENTLALNHKLDKLIESLKSLPKKTNEEDLADHEYREQQDLEVEDTIGILMEVEPFDQTQLDDVGLNTSSHDLFLSSREIPSVDELEPQLLPNFSPLDVNLGDKRGTDLPINPYSLGSFRMKVVYPLTIHAPPLPHVAYFHRNALGWNSKEIHVTWAHLEKKCMRLQLYTKVVEEKSSQWLETASEILVMPSGL
ncbi:hypothetical protein Tco_1167324 [Tanacetum coccineum]